MTGCAMAAFLRPAYFAGISTTRHMAGSNLATLLALALSVALAASMGYRAVTRVLARPRAPAAVPGDPVAVPVGPGFDRVGRGSLCPAGRTWINVGHDPFLC
jgi:hypothetical protein